MNRNKFVSFFTLACFMILLLTGCGSKTNQTNTTPGDQKTGEQKTEGTQPQTNSAGDNKQITGDKKNELGIQEGVLPADYPGDLPKPKDSKVLGSLNTSEGMTVTFESTAKPKDILADYTSALDKAGFKKEGEEQMKDNGGMVMWKKEKREISLMLAWDDSKKITSTVVTYK